MQSVKDAHAKNPEAFKARGKAKAAHHFEGLNLLDQPNHAKAMVEGLPENLKQKFAQPAPTQSAPTPAPSAPAAAEPTSASDKLAAIKKQFGVK
jgi:hypothetical protein